jgi:hypothetical protein
MNNRLKIILVFLSIKLTSTLFNREVMGGLEDKFIGKLCRLLSLLIIVIDPQYNSH